MDVGAELRRAREERALSLEELSRRTKIGLPALRAIESNQVERLPGGIFTRGFVQAYAREVGLDPADVSRRYAAQFQPVVVVQPVDGAVPAPAVADSQHPHDTRRVSDRIDLVRIGRAVAIVALIAVSYFELSRPRSPGPPRRIESPRAVGIVSTAGGPQPQKGAPARAATATTGSLDVRLPSAASDLVLRVDLHPPQTCWVSATADGRRVIYRLMLAGERQTIEARDDLVLRVGDPALFAFSINGLPGGPLGPAGEPVTVRITPQNHRKFVGR